MALPNEDLPLWKRPGMKAIPRWRTYAASNVVVCLLALGVPEKASALLPPANDDAPSSSYSWSMPDAAVFYARKNFAKADEAVGEARKSFSAEVENLYTDSFVELRWGKRDAEGKFNFTPPLP